MNTAVPCKLRYKYACTDNQLERNNDALCDLICVDDMASFKLFATLPTPTSGEPMFEPMSEEEMSTAEFYDDFCVHIRRRLNGGGATVR